MELTLAATSACRRKKRTRSRRKQRHCVLMSAVCFPSENQPAARRRTKVTVVPQTKANKSSQTWWKLSCLHVSFPSPPPFAPFPSLVSLCHSVFSKKNPHALGLLSLRKKKKSGTKNCILAPLLTCKESGWCSPTGGLTGIIPLGAQHQGPEDWETRGEGRSARGGEGKCLTWQIFFNSATSAWRGRFYR